MGKRYPVLLFDDNPPTDEFIDAVFCDRVDELKFALEMLGSGTEFRKICAVHGMTRSGKSHLLLKIFNDVRSKGLGYIVFGVNANNKEAARSVLEELFFEMWREIEPFPEENVPDGAGLAFSGGVEFLRSLEPLVAGEKTQASLTRTEEVLSGGGATIGLAPPPFKIEASGKVELKEGLAKQWTEGVPSDRNMVELLRYEADLLALLNPGNTILLFVDDLDLLDWPGSEPKQKEAHRLVELLKPLAESTSTLVIATVRQAYFNGRDKSFKDFLKVGLFGQPSLFDIYQRHIEVFNDGAEVFTSEALEWIARGAAGRAGIFLYRCFELWRKFHSSDDTLIGIDEVRRFVRDHISELRQDPAHGDIMADMEAALRGGHTEMSFRGDLSETKLLFHVLIPLPGRREAYRINPIYAEVIRELQEGVK